MSCAVAWFAWARCRRRSFHHDPRPSRFRRRCTSSASARAGTPPGRMDSRGDCRRCGDRGGDGRVDQLVRPAHGSSLAQSRGALPQSRRRGTGAHRRTPRDSHDRGHRPFRDSSADRAGTAGRRGAGVGRRSSQPFRIAVDGVRSAANADRRPRSNVAVSRRSTTRERRNRRRKGPGPARVSRRSRGLALAAAGSCSSWPLSR